MSKGKLYSADGFVGTKVDSPSGCYSIIYGKYTGPKSSSLENKTYILRSNKKTLFKKRTVAGNVEHRIFTADVTDCGTFVLHTLTKSPESSETLMVFNSKGTLLYRNWFEKPPQLGKLTPNGQTLMIYAAGVVLLFDIINSCSISNVKLPERVWPIDIKYSANNSFFEVLVRNNNWYKIAITGEFIDHEKWQEECGDPLYPNKELDGFRLVDKAVEALKAGEKLEEQMVKELLEGLDIAMNEKRMEQYPNYMGKLYRSRGELLQLAGNNKAAITAYETALKLNSAAGCKRQLATLKKQV